MKNIALLFGLLIVLGFTCSRKVATPILDASDAQTEETIAKVEEPAEESIEFPEEVHAGILQLDIASHSTMTNFKNQASSQTFWVLYWPPSRFHDVAWPHDQIS